MSSNEHNDLSNQNLEGTLGLPVRRGQGLLRIGLGL